LTVLTVWPSSLVYSSSAGRPVRLPTGVSSRRLPDSSRVFSTKEQYKQIEVRKIEMDRELDAASKMDRHPSFVREMFTYGEEQAEEFLKGVS
jgi:hypothetical protein